MAGHQMYHNGYSTSGGNGSSNFNGYSHARNRPFTVEEAIPQSPCSSILPYDTDTIPLPQIGLRASTSLYTTHQDSEIARQTIASLDREATNPHSTSRRLQQTLHELQQLLKPESLTEYKFDPIPTLDPADHSFRDYVPEPAMSSFSQMLFDSTEVAFTTYAPPISPAPRNMNGYKKEAPLQNRSPKVKSKGISSPQVKPAPKVKAKPIEQLREPEVNTINPALLFNQPPARTTPILPHSAPILADPDTTEVQTINPAQLQKPQDVKPKIEVKPKTETPILPPVKISKHGQPQNSTPKPKTERPILPPVKVNNHAHPKHSQFEVKSLTPKPPSRPKTPPKVTPLKGTPPKVTPVPVPDTLRPAIQVVVPDLPPTVSRTDYTVYPDPPSPLKISSKLRKSSEGISDAILSSRPDQRERAEAARRKLKEYLQDLFNAQDSYDNSPPSPLLVETTQGEVTLSTTAQIKVESLVSAAITSGSFLQIAIDDLVRLQKMCENALKPSEFLNVRIEETWNEGDLEPWLKTLTFADLSLKAARTALRMMTAGREDRQLYSEEIIQMSLEGLKNVMESCMIPIVELRSSGSSSNLFKLLSAQKKDVTGLLVQCRKLLSLLAELVSKLELSDIVINTLEFVSSQLIFVENAHGEKDSVLGTQKFDAVRLVAMDVLSQIFLKYPAQRSGIISEILTSLEKLPVARQRARHFKLVEGGSIQLVSALIMKLVQTSANRSNGSATQRRSGAFGTGSDDDADGDIDEPALASLNGIGSRDEIFDNERSAGTHHSAAISSLDTISSQLRSDAKNSATIVVTFIIERAQRSTKTGDTPFRNLLDLFIEDFITCLSSPDWPAAELLLRFFAFKMVNLAEADKTPAPAKNMALDSLGVMGAAISELNSHVRKTALALENRDVGQGSKFAVLADAILDGKDQSEDIIRWNGPFRATLEFLLERDSADKLVHGAMGYITAEWAAQICARYEKVDEDDVESLQDFGRVAYRLRVMITETGGLSAVLLSRHVEPSHARLAFATTLLSSEFCRAFDRVLMILLNAMSSDQASVRSKSLRTVNQVLETDPSILDRSLNILRAILRCSDDPSTQVRDAALGLIGKCIGLKPTLEEEMIPGILQRFLDTAVGVRKRAIKLSKEIYLRNNNKMVRSSIADALLHRVVDLDEGVQELARQTIEEVWISPFYRPTTATDEVSVQTQLAMNDMVSLMIRTGQRPGVSAVMEKVLQGILSADSKIATANFRVCKSLVTTMFETIIDNPNGENGNGSGARDALQLLMIFAKANPKLFTADQVQLLQPYITNLGNDDDMVVYHSVIVIFRHVLPHLSKVHHGFLVDIRGKLIPAMSRLKRSLLDDVVACLWIISVTLNSFDHLSRFTLSVLKGIDGVKKVNLSEPKNSDHVRKLVKLLLLCGMCGKNCDFDSQEKTFKAQFPAWKGKSVSKLMVDIFSPFTSPTQPQEVRRAALDAIGLVCPSWPKNFSQVNIYTAFQIVFEEQIPVLEAVILRSFKEFLLLEEKRSEASGEAATSATGNGEAPTALAVMGGSHGDGVAISIAQRFMDAIVRIAMSTQDDHALLATEVIASINRQGLVHPTECAHVLVALETSQNPKIADIAFNEHRSLHEKHETLLEKKYMKGVQTAFTYQKDIVKDSRGLLFDPYTSKLHLLIEVFKISKPKSRKRFLERLCEAVDFDPQKLDVRQDMPVHLGLSRFIVENVAFINYVSVEELLATITAMEKVVSNTGTGIAQSIEEEIFNTRLTHSQTDGDAIMIDDQKPHTPDSAKLRKLTIFSMILSALWEARTYLRRSYGLLPNRTQAKNTKKDKDVSKAPIKVQGVTGDQFVDPVSAIMGALTSHDTMMAQCKAFVDLMTIDSDVKIIAEDEDDAKRFQTPSDDEEGTPNPQSSSGRGRKRKNSNTPGGRKKRARSGSRPRAEEEDIIEWV